MSAPASRIVLHPPRWLLPAIATLLVIAIVPMAGLIPTAACVISLLSVGIAIAAHRASHGHIFPVPPASLAFALAGVFSLAQAVPLPIFVAKLFASNNAELWASSLTAVGDGAPFFLPLSLAPQLTIVEGAKWLGYAATVWVAFIWARSHGTEKLAWVVLCVATFAGVATVLHGVLGASHVWGVYAPHTDFPRWRIGPILNTNHLSGLLNLGVFCGLALLFSRREISTLPSLAVMVMTSGLMIGVLLLASRAAVGMLLLGVIASVALRRTNNSKERGGNPVAILVPSLLLGSVALSLLGYQENILQQLSERDISKLRVARDAIPMVRDHWFVGVGRGAFESAFFAYRSDSVFESWTHPENLIVQWTTEWGLPLSLLVGMTVVIGLYDAKGWQESTIVRLLLLALVVLGIHNLFDFSLEAPAIAMPACVLLGAVLGSKSSKRRKWTRWELDRDAMPTRALGVAFVCVAIVSALIPLARRTGSVADLRDRVFVASKIAPKQGAEAAREAMRQLPADPYFPYTVAQSLSREQPLEALAWFNLALQRGPRVAQVHLALADTFGRMGAHMQALVHVKKVLELDDHHIDAAGRLVALYAHDMDTIKAFVVDGPAWEERFLSATLKYLPVGSPLRDQLTSLTIERDTCAGEARVAAARLKLTHLKEASNECAGELKRRCARELDEELKRIGTCPDAGRISNELMADFLWITDQKKDALILWEELCSKVESNELTPCLQRIVEKAASIQDTDRVRRNLKVVVSRRCEGTQECAKAWQWAADVHAQSGDTYSAYSDMSKACDLDPSNVDLRVRLADAALKIGAKDKALLALNTALSRRPGDAAIQAKIAQLSSAPPVSSKR
jgi:tetratricopeptide (TPR) repeat protein